MKNPIPPCPVVTIGDRAIDPHAVITAIQPVPVGVYHAGNDEKRPTLAEQIRLARTEVPRGEYHIA